MKCHLLDRLEPKFIGANSNTTAFSQTLSLEGEEAPGNQSYCSSGLDSQESTMVY